MKKLDYKLVNAVATLLCQPAATHPDFFAAVAMATVKQGYKLEANQRGVQGTYLAMVKQKVQS